jgi:hypothetical protein
MTKKQQSTPNVIVGTVKKSIAAIASRWFRRKASQRLAGSGSLGTRFIQPLPLPLSNRFGLSAIGKPDFCMSRTRLPTTGFCVTGARGIQVTGGYSAGVPAVAGSSGDEHPIYVYAW